MDLNDTIINIDQQAEDVEANNSQSEVKTGPKDSQPGTVISAASTSCNAGIDGNSEEHAKSYKDSSNEGPVRHKDEIMNEKVGQSSVYEYRPAPFSTLEEYNTKMKEDIVSGRAGKVLKE
ncbi:hypothetical protein BGW38_003295 [Lunasporangiospora selenospora]|uniref:Uncharacterized protein n=1 Tax=Lunasporangiospora selenospora TaxID=979761 RepID=A0A9P6KCY2_9FUNG|nr:hypothetical protein BGW38_003295 [Lunasporangiospora selenospora]